MIRNDEAGVSTGLARQYVSLADSRRRDGRWSDLSLDVGVRDRTPGVVGLGASCCRNSHCCREVDESELHLPVWAVPFFVPSILVGTYPLAVRVDSLASREVVEIGVDFRVE